MCACVRYLLHELLYHLEVHGVPADIIAEHGLPGWDNLLQLHVAKGSGRQRVAKGTEQGSGKKVDGRR